MQPINTTETAVAIITISEVILYQEIAGVLLRQVL